jgi:hypothetical protein
VYENTRHIATRINFLRELKEYGLISVQWISNEGMSSDIFTKNVGSQDFYRHRGVIVRENPSIECVGPATTCVLVGKGVGDRLSQGCRNWIDAGPPAVEYSTGVTGGAKGDFNDEVDSGEEHVATVVAVREE